MVLELDARRVVALATATIPAHAITVSLLPLPLAGGGKCYYLRKGQTKTCAQRGLPRVEWCGWCLQSS